MKRHGLSGTKIYKVWKSMRVKCYSSNKDNHHRKGDIWICDDWRDDPVAFVSWAEQNGYKEGLQLVRRNKEDGYHPKNCVFLKKEEATKSHGMRYSRLYNIWTQVIQRCTNKNNNRFDQYGGRGVTLCDEWMDFEVFAEWAKKNGYRDDLSIDRIDVDGMYQPSNCKWSTDTEQQRNKRNSRYININGVKKTVAEWAEISEVPYKTLLRRLNKGCKEENLLAPVGTIYTHKYLIEINGVEKTINTWARESGLAFSTIKRRYQRGIRGEALIQKGRVHMESENQLSLDL